MRALMAIVVGLGVLILAGFAVIVVTVVHRLGTPVPAANLVLDEPPGTHIASASESAGALTAVLQGGGPDRVVVIDLSNGRRLGRVSLAH